MNEYDRFFKELKEKGTSKMRAFGQSMRPKIQSGSLLTYETAVSYEVGDIVFCKVKGNYIRAHIITQKDGDRYMISNNHGRQNGWTRQVYAKVVAIEPPT